VGGRYTVAIEAAGNLAQALAGAVQPLEPSRRRRRQRPRPTEADAFRALDRQSLARPLADPLALGLGEGGDHEGGSRGKGA
jgi:hypothetical protein